MNKFRPIIRNNNLMIKCLILKNQVIKILKNQKCFNPYSIFKKILKTQKQKIQNYTIKSEIKLNKKTNQKLQVSNKTFKTCKSFWPNYKKTQIIQILTRNSIKKNRNKKIKINKIKKTKKIKKKNLKKQNQEKLNDY